MKTWQALACACVLLGIVGCKGGGGGKKAQQQAPAAASVSVSISTPEIVGESIVGDAGYRAALNGTWTGSNLGSGQVWLEVSDSAGTFVMPARQQASGSGFGYTLALAGGLAEGARSGNLTVRACKDAQCTQPYANASASVGYRVQVREPVVRVAIATPPLAETVDPGDAATVTFAVGGTWTATYLGSNPVYLQISDNAGTFVSPAPVVASGDGRFQYTLPIANALPNGPRSGLITVRACRDALCTQPYRDATMSIAYQLRIERIAEWETHQRNAAHDGYVPITLDYRRFRQAWEWQLPPGTDVIGGINAVATSDGTVYTSTDVYGSLATLYALDEATGQPRWSQAIGVMPAMNPPAYHDGRVYVSTTGHADTFLWSFDADDGTFRFKNFYNSQWGNSLAPTVYDGQVYNTGQWGIYAYDRLSGADVWQGSVSDDDMATPAVDENHAYFHTGSSMKIWDRRTGVVVADISDPLANPANNYKYNGSPILGARDNVIAYAGSSHSGRAAASSEPNIHRVLSSFNIGSRTWEWSTQQAYLTQPALANGVLYAGRNHPMSLDAIDEATGQVLWSWTPPAIHGDATFQRNIVATRNLLFVSTNRSVYAIDLATREAVWRYEEPGMLAISANRTLYITTGLYVSDGKLVAIRLQ